MDYKELIEKLREKDRCQCECLQAANAIETLLTERDAAVEGLRGQDTRESGGHTVMTDWADGRYRAIYADPPWSFQAWSAKGNGRSAERHYRTMGPEEIKALPVGDLADRDCVLFLWATLPMIQRALETIEAWGFTYKTTAFVWIKQNRRSNSLFWGMGYWTRSNAEICLLATRGSPKRISAGVHQVIVSPVEEHSKKPDEVRDRIVALVGDVPRIELFARQRADGWDAWGDELPEVER